MKSGPLPPVDVFVSAPDFDSRYRLYARWQPEGLSERMVQFGANASKQELGSYEVKLRELLLFVFRAGQACPRQD